MIITLALTAMQALQPPLEKQQPRTSARASLVIKRSVVVSERSWQEAPEHLRREVVVREPTGAQRIMRLVEFE